MILLAAGITHFERFGQFITITLIMTGSLWFCDAAMSWVFLFITGGNDEGQKFAMPEHST